MPWPACTGEELISHCFKFEWYVWLIVLATEGALLMLILLSNLLG